MDDLLPYFPLPKGDWDTIERIVAERISADPVAAAIDDLEAEAYVASILTANQLVPKHFNKMCRAFGIRFPNNERERHRALWAVARQWQRPFVRKHLVFVSVNMLLTGLPDTALKEAWTDEVFERAYDDKTNIVYLAHLRRAHRGNFDLAPWLQSLGPWAAQDYAFYIRVGKLGLSNVLAANQGAGPSVQAAAALQAEPDQELVRDLRAKDRQTGTLRKHLRQAQQQRRETREETRRRELAARAALDQARGEVAAARAALAELLVRQQRELAEQAERHAAARAGLQKLVAAERQLFVREVRALCSNRRAAFLAGRSVTVLGPEGNNDLYRPLVTALGATWAPKHGQVVIQAPEGGMAAFERTLRHEVMKRIIISCDGLYRRKPGRHGVAVASFQVAYGDHPALAFSQVVCCGPTAGSLMAEYGALTMALQWLSRADLAPDAEVEIRSDCRTMLGRLSNRRRVRPKLGCVQLHRKAQQLVLALQRGGLRPCFIWVPREHVHAVDRLCYRTYRNLSWYHSVREPNPVQPLATFLHAVGRTVAYQDLGEPASAGPQITRRSVYRVAAPAGIDP